MFFGSLDDVFRATLIGVPTYCGTVIAAVAFAGDDKVSARDLRMPDESEALNGLASDTINHPPAPPDVLRYSAGADNEK